MLQQMVHDREMTIKQLRATSHYYCNAYARYKEHTAMLREKIRQLEVKVMDVSREHIALLKENNAKERYIDKLENDARVMRWMDEHDVVEPDVIE